MRRPGGFERRPFSTSDVPEVPEVADLTDVPEIADLQEAADVPEADSPVGLAPAELGDPAAESVPATKSRKLPSFKSRSLDPIQAAERRVRAAERQQKKRIRRETRRFTQAIRHARRRVLVSVGAVLLLVVFVLVGAFTPLMSVRTVQVEGAGAVNADEVTAALQHFEGVPLALVDENEVLRALEGFPLIQRFGVERVPPHTLLVRIEERVPAIALEDDGVFQQYDAAGVLVAETSEKPAGVPLGEGSLRTTSSPAFHAASTIVRDMPAELRGQLVSAKATSNQDVTFVLESGIEVFWGSADETRRKALLLQTMLQALEGRAVSHIDVSSTSAPIFK